MYYLLLIVSTLMFGCASVPPPPTKGFVVPDSCEDRWVCEADCDPDYPFLCEPWSTDNE